MSWWLELESGEVIAVEDTRYPGKLSGLLGMLNKGAFVSVPLGDGSQRFVNPKSVKFLRELPDVE